eukprot:1157590-Pelagomonas_calceolata.AAC.1
MHHHPHHFMQLLPRCSHKKLRRASMGLPPPLFSLYQQERWRLPGSVPASLLAAAAEMFNEFCRANMGPPPPGATYPSVDPADYDPWSPEPNHKFHMPCSCGFDHIATKVPGRT